MKTAHQAHTLFFGHAPLSHKLYTEVTSLKKHSFSWLWGSFPNNWCLVSNFTDMFD